jgi:hypothetical protein
MITSPICCSSRIISSGEVSCAASAKAWIIPVSWIGKKPWESDGQRDGQRHGGEEHADRDPLVPQHNVERAFIERRHGVEAPLDKAIDAAVAFGARCMKRAHIMGASVSETRAEMAMAAVTVSANSRNSRPMMPPIRSSGMNTAISEHEIDSTVKPISRDP